MNQVPTGILSGGVVVTLGFASYLCLLLLGIPDVHFVLASGLSLTSHSFAEVVGNGALVASIFSAGRAVDHSSSGSAGA